MSFTPAVLLVFVDRTRRAREYPWLPWKVRLFLVGAVLAVAGMGLESGLLVGIAIGILVLGFLVRFLPGGRGVAPEDDEEWDDEEWDEEEWDEEEGWGRA